MKALVFASLVLACSSAAAQEPGRGWCGYAPSQHTLTAGTTGVFAGGAATAAGAGGAVSAAGVSAVLHSSTAYILTGPGGYMAGTLGAPAAVVAALPYVVGAGVVVGAAAAGLELACVGENHPERVARVRELGHKAGERFHKTLRPLRNALGNSR